MEFGEDSLESHYANWENHNQKQNYTKGTRKVQRKLFLEKK